MGALYFFVYIGGATACVEQIGFWRAVFWPLYLGRYLAKISLRDYFETVEHE